MAGIYIHIPFCKQACHYCNFHFTTSLRYKNELLAALLKELVLQKVYPGINPVRSVYFGGGTPSLLDLADINQLLSRVNAVFQVSPDAEITLEANPDDITGEKLAGWKSAGINRLSIGIQSFFQEDLEWMNRAHTAGQATENLELALRYFRNITIDLIYGTPGLTHEKWEQNVKKAIALGIPHLSCYALTVESKTPLDKLIRKEQYEPINPDQQSEQFLLLMKWMEEAGYEHYEISNFALPGWRSRHNSSYWQSQPYLGIGPAAHSYSGKERQWNIANNNSYIHSINQGIIPFEKEILTETQQLNEYIMTSLRTLEGLDTGKVNEERRFLLEASAKKYVDAGLLQRAGERLLLTNEGKLLADGIAAALFF
ncbi:MAG: radical SAM family heme chaperone HemW [Sphingobacteriales bacterium]|nr:radical SAM family heme chaperone HemW [Sphingobacteriales bacterium]